MDPRPMGFANGMFAFRGDIVRYDELDKLTNLPLLDSHHTQLPPPPPCISYALVPATVGVGTVIIVYVILITYEM